MRSIVLGLCALFGLSACYIVPVGHGQPSLASEPLGLSYHYSARLYPSNAAAQRYGVGSAEIRSQAGHSTFIAQLGAERFTGEASRDASLAGNQGIANGISANNNYLNCQYAMNGSNGKGHCITADQARFDMHIVAQ